jgi:hypothetical protein
MRTDAAAQTIDLGNGLEKRCPARVVLFLIKRVSD